MLTTCFLAVAVVGLAIKYIDPETLQYIGLVLMFGGLIYLAYSINLGQLKYEEKLQDLNKSIQNLKVDK
jgi:hypothetical protein